ncbi:hypothetical protein DV736_g910, partial [Chaetothyriales sp. CBS 134916]
MFSCFPRPASQTSSGKLPITILERHPYTTQTFSPLALSTTDMSTCFLVVVAPSLPNATVNAVAKPPDLANLKAFVARGDQAVTYAPGTWHAPMIVLGKTRVDFVVTQFVNGLANDDCQEVNIDRVYVSLVGLPIRSVLYPSSSHLATPKIVTEFDLKARHYQTARPQGDGPAHPASPLTRYAPQSMTWPMDCPAAPDSSVPRHGNDRAHDRAHDRASAPDQTVQFREIEYSDPYDHGRTFTRRVPIKPPARASSGSELSHHTTEGSPQPQAQQHGLLSESAKKKLASIATVCGAEQGLEFLMEGVGKVGDSA